MTLKGALDLKAHSWGFMGADVRENRTEAERSDCHGDYSTIRKTERLESWKCIKFHKAYNGFIIVIFN